MKNKVHYLSCIEGKGGLKDIRCIAQNPVLFVDLLQNIFCITNQFEIKDTVLFTKCLRVRHYINLQIKLGAETQGTRILCRQIWICDFWGGFFLNIHSFFLCLGKYDK